MVSTQAQPLPFNHGERVDYELYFKWGLIMSRAGQASLSVQETEFKEQPAWNYSLHFRSSGIIEKVFRMRDTMECFYTKEPRLLFSSKRTDDGGYYSVDNLSFTYKEKEQVDIHSFRYNLKRTKIDTVLTSNGLVFDMLAATMYLRSIDWSNLNHGAEFPFEVAIGRDVVKARFRYTGQHIVKHESVKYRTRHFYIDIYDEAFVQTKEAAEVWIGDDGNHIPVKIRTKLKIGAAEVYYKDSENLRVPITCRVVMPKR